MVSIVRKSFLVFSVSSLSFVGNAVFAAPVVEVNANTTQVDVQTEAPTIQADTQVVEASPVDLPMSSKLREKRQKLELQTEEEMTQELEKARIADEKSRKDKIFGNRIAPLAEPAPSVEPVIAAPAPAPQAPVVVPAAPQIVNKVVVNNNTVQVEEDKKSFSIALSGGVLNYPMVENVPTANGVGLATLGFNLFNNFWLNVGALYSYQEAEINRAVSLTTDTIDQFGAVGSLNYQLQSSSRSWLIPVVGVAVSYTGRSYNGGDNSSNALDAGLLAGLDIAMNRSLTLGVEYRYMMNVDYEREKNVASEDVALQKLASGLDVKNLESFDYQMLLVALKMKF